MSETGLETAVIGLAGRFPGAADICRFWENLKQGVESIYFFADQELAGSGLEPEMVDNPAYVRARGVLEEFDYFDAAFFNFTPGEAEVMDPQLRIFLECSWQALEDAGYNPHGFGGTVGVYAGHATNHHWIARAMGSPKYRLFGKFKTDLLNTHFSTQVSYHLNLKGPSLTVNTACSTSLVAIHLACIALLGSECDMALAGGVALALPPRSGYLYQPGMIGSVDGHCRAFDSRAKGTVVGSGAGVVVLKQLEDARADRDHIYAVVKGTAINNDGWRKVGYTAPSVEGQAEAIRAAYMMAEVDPATVGYIETHGTGTELGDPVEIEALNMVFHNGRERSIPIGSLKTNVGHLDSAAGVSGFIKTVLILSHRQIPASLHFQAPNPGIDFAGGPFYVNNRLTAWNNSAGPRRAGVSSFGLGGTNVHAVLEEAPAEAVMAAESACPFRLILLSARTGPALERQTENLVTYLRQNPALNLGDAAYTLQVGRKSFAWRRMVVAAGVGEAVELLSARSRRVKSAPAAKEAPAAVFLLSGQGSQYVDMGRALYHGIMPFRREMDGCFGVLESLLGWDIKSVVYPPGSTTNDRGQDTPSAEGIRSRGSFVGNAAGRSLLSPGDPPHLDRPEIAQPLLFAFEYCLARLLMGWGITPRALIGYSFGEYVAACLAGVFSLEDALRVAVARGRLMHRTAAAAMLSVPLTAGETAPLLEGCTGVWLAIDNGPSCIVAGTLEAVGAFEAQMRERRLLCAPVHMSRAVHSPLMEPIRREFEEELGTVTLNPPQIPYISNVSGTWISPQQAVDPAYWGRHLCTTVRFSRGIDTLLSEQEAVWIEIGPGRLLGNIVRQHFGPSTPQRIVNMVKHQQERAGDDYYLLNKLGELWLCGLTVDWSSFYGSEQRRRLSLPTYAFERQRYWIEGEPFAAAAAPAPAAASTPEPVPETVLPQAEDDDIEGPRDELEENIARLWQDFLGFPRLGITDNFFEINGDSLTASQLISRLQQMYPVEIPLKSFFENPTIAHLGEVIRALLKEKIDNLSEEELAILEGD